MLASSAAAIDMRAVVASAFRPTAIPVHDDGDVNAVCDFTLHYSLLRAVRLFQAVNRTN